MQNLEYVLGFLSWFYFVCFFPVVMTEILDIVHCLRSKTHKILASGPVCLSVAVKGKYEKLLWWAC